MNHSELFQTSGTSFKLVFKTNYILDKAIPENFIN